MALIKCSECGHEVSDKAEACPGCGAPISVMVKQQTAVPSEAHYNLDTDTFTGTMVLMVKLAMRAVQKFGWKIDQANETSGLVTFQTGMSWGSWSGVLCSLNIEEVAPNIFRVSGTGKQNVAGGQIIAFNIGGEAQEKVSRVMDQMKQWSCPNFKPGECIGKSKLGSSVNRWRSDYVDSYNKIYRKK
jgi:DNA-directed RNA polymerase subunit RPC12/RpoP